MNRLLVPLDGSAAAEQVLPYIEVLAPMLAARVRLMRVVSDEDVARLLVHEGALAHEIAEQSIREPISPARLADLLRQDAAAYLVAQTIELRAAGAQVESILRDGSPAEQIVEVASHENDSTIAMATHGYSGLRRWALGSVADKVLHAATCPVFLIRTADQPRANPWSVKRILVPLDGSVLAERALPLAIDMARRAHAELVILHVVIPLVDYAPGLAPFSRLSQTSIRFPHVLCEQAEQQLAATIDRFDPGDLVFTAAVVLGYPAEAIIDQAQRRRADLIVMATHGYSGLRRWALGSVADKVLHASTVPLLLVRSQSDKPARLS